MLLLSLRLCICSLRNRLQRTDSEENGIAAENKVVTGRQIFMQIHIFLKGYK